jgi:hypothetical protein
MGKFKLSSFDPINWVLIARDASGDHINGMGSRGDLEYARSLAYSFLRTDRLGAATIDIYQKVDIPWQNLQPVVTVSLDDDEGVEDGE